MRSYIIASHGLLAEGIMDSVRIIFGEQENVTTLCAYVDPGENIKDRVKSLLDSYPEDREIIVVADIMGGSVCNEFMCHLDRENLHVIAGMNLPMLLEMFAHRHSEVNNLINVAVKAGALSVHYCNPMGKEIVDEEF